MPEEQLPPEGAIEIDLNLEAPDNDGEEVVAEDPGALEGVKDKTPKRPEPPVDSPRWKEVYHKAKESERQLDTLTKTLAEKDQAFEELRRHNEELAKAIAGVQATQAEAKTSDEKTGIVGAIEALKAQRKAAIAEQDLALVYDLQDQIEEMKEKLKSVDAIPAKNIPGKDVDVDKLVSAAVAKREQEAAVATFVHETPWFDQKSEKYDPIMAAAANKVDEILSADPVWSAKPLVEQFREVKRRVEERFNVTSAPSKAKDGRLPAPNVGGVDTGGGNFKGKITLTSAQRHAARMFFPDNPKAEEIYAEQIAAMNKRRA